MRLIPAEYRLAHESSYFLHDESAQLQIEYDKAGAHLVSINFTNKKEEKLFKQNAKTAASQP